MKTNLSYEKLEKKIRALKRKIENLKGVEKRLAKLKQHYSTIADFTWDWEFWLNPDRKFIYVSPSCKRIKLPSPNLMNCGH